VTKTGLYISKGETFLGRFHTDSISNRLFFHEALRVKKEFT